MQHILYFKALDGRDIYVYDVEREDGRRTLRFSFLCKIVQKEVNQNGIDRCGSVWMSSQYLPTDEFHGPDAAATVSKQAKSQDLMQAVFRANCL